MSKQQKKSKNASKPAAYTLIKKYKTISSYRLQNGLSVLYMHIPNTGVVTTNITYRVGARDERTGETGLAHMLEHMLFKPTAFDLAQKIDSGAMQFERETGAILNATTWKDRTTYYFSYPKEYFNRALTIEAQRMRDVVLTDKEFLPERNNVLSEFDMYFGDPNFALSIEMVCSSFHSHPYGHETIGFREDIERFTCEKLKSFYDRFYDPTNATLIIVGDIEESDAIKRAASILGAVPTHGLVQRNDTVKEPKQEGLRRISIQRPSATNVVAFGVRHAGFPSKAWFETSLLSSMLTGSPDSVLYKALVDTGMASKVEMSVEPTQEENIALLFVTLSKKATHAEIEKIVMDTIHALTVQNLSKEYKKAQQHIITEEIISRESSLNIALELTEYVSAGTWETFFDTEDILKQISVRDIVDCAKKLFTEKQMVIGNFIGS